MTDVLFFWTPVAVLTAILAGVVYGVVKARLMPLRDARRFAGMVALAGTFYFLPIMVQRFLDPALFANGLRTVGTFGLFLLFCSALGITSALIGRLRSR